MNGILNFSGFVFKLLVLVGLLAQSCSSPDKAGIVEFSGTQYINITSYSTYELLASGIDGKLAAFLTDYSLLIVNDRIEEEAFTYLYRLEDGKKIDLKITENLLFVNGKVRSIKLAGLEDSNFLDWFDSAESEALQPVRIIEINNENLETHYASLLSIAKLNPHVSFLNLEDNGGFTELQSITRPMVLFLSDYFTAEQINQIDLSETKLVYVSEGLSPAVIEDLIMPDIYRLIADDYGDNTARLMNTFPDIKALSILENSTLTNLSTIEHLANLHELHIIFGDSINISGLANAHELEVLTIVGDTLRGVENIKNLKYLNPGIIDQKQLETILSSNPDLVFLNLLYCDLESLEPLEKAGGLKGITLGGENIDSLSFSPLAALPELHYLGLPSGLENEQETMDKIRSACPDCIIYKHQGFCLGSGWLILFIPLLLILLLAKKHQMTRRYKF